MEKILRLEIFKEDDGYLASDIEFEAKAIDVINGISKGVSRVLTLIADDENTKHTKDELLDILIEDVRNRFIIDEE